MKKLLLLALLSTTADARALNVLALNVAHDGYKYERVKEQADPYCGNVGEVFQSIVNAYDNGYEKAAIENIMKAPPKEGENPLVDPIIRQVAEGIIFRVYDQKQRATKQHVLEVQVDCLKRVRQAVMAAPQ